MRRLVDLTETCTADKNGQPCTTENATCNGSICVCNSDYKPNEAGTACVEDNSQSGPTTEPPCKVSVNAPATPKYGNYTVKASSDSGNTIDDSGVTGAYFRYDNDVAIGAKQETPQTVDSTSSDKKSFTVAFDDAVTTALPRFYAEEKSEKEIPCTLSSDNKTATCTPTKDHMKDGKKYTIHYRTDCAKTGTTTGIEVEFESSAYAKLGSVLLIALGVFLL